MIVGDVGYISILWFLVNVNWLVVNKEVVGNIFKVLVEVFEIICKDLLCVV